MKNPIYIAAVAMIVCLVQPVLAQQPASPPPSAAQAQTAPTPEEMDKQFAKMQEQMAKMNEQMSKIRETKDPQERQRLLQEHWSTMQSAMGMMHGMGGQGAMGGHMMGGKVGGPMMGGHMMMWGDYRNLTPEQLKERQYMMDRWMPMQQMMMDHMMQHQNWMMQPTPATPTAK